MAGGLIILALLGALFAWISSGIRANKLAGQRGVKYVLMHFLFAILSIVFLWVIIVVPSLDCTGFLCGLGAFIMFFIIGTIVILVWPLLLIVTLKSKFANSELTKTKEDDDLLDI